MTALSMVYIIVLYIYIFFFFHHKMTKASKMREAWSKCPLCQRLDIFVSLDINYVAHTVHDPFGKNYMSFPLISSCSVRVLFPHTGSFRYHSAYVSTYRYISIPFL